MPGVQESVAHEWEGDVDLNDGQVQSTKAIYDTVRLKSKELLGLRRSKDAIADDASYLRAKFLYYVAEIDEGKSVQMSLVYCSFCL